MLEIRNIIKKYKLKNDKDVVALNNVSINFPSNGMVFLTGKSGSGKSTMLNLLALLDKPDSGEILVDNKEINKFNGKEIDSYRNSYIGFVFQDYNLLEDLNIFKNVELSVDLQKKKVGKDVIKNVLKKVGLEWLENRKVNELSGGQKQRVAIARTLIKNPKVILADEPTGNLDNENSIQIFNILKELSKTRLVIVVTHNVELAKKYADRLIELENGNIKSDILVNDSSYIEDKSFELINSRLSFFKALSLSFANLKRKKLKLVIVSFLITLSLSVFGFSSLLTKFNTDLMHAEAMIENNEKNIVIEKKIIGKQYTNFSHIISFSNKEIDEVINKLGSSDIIISNKVIENNFPLNYNVGNRNDKVESNGGYAYYSMYSTLPLFLEYSDEKLKSLNLIGEIPKNNEVVINKITADYFIEFGLKVRGIDDNGNIIEVDYFPSSYHEIINDRKEIILGSSYFIVSGIIDEDLSKYDSLKTVVNDEMIINPIKLYEEFKTKYVSKLDEFIVSKDFFESLNLEENNILSKDLYKEVYIFNGKRTFINSLMAYMKEDVTISNGIDNVLISNLEDNQIVLSLLSIDEIYNNEFTDGFLEYLNSFKENGDVEVEYNQVLNEYLNKFIIEKNWLVR